MRILALQEYRRFRRRLHAAATRISRADDTNDGRIALRELESARAELEAVVRDLGAREAVAPPDPGESAVFGRIHERLEAVARGERFIHDTELPTLVQRAIRALWRTAGEAEDLLRTRRPRTALALDTALPFALAAAAALIGAAVWWARQQACPGFRVTYYRGADFTRPAATRYEPALVKDYGPARPALGLPRDGWCARWEAVLKVPADDEYAFFAQGLDGFRVTLDGAVLMENLAAADWNAGARHASLRLARGDHRFVVEHFNTRGPAALRVRWTGGGIPPNTVVAAPQAARPPES